MYRFVGGDFTEAQTLVDFNQRFFVRCGVVLDEGKTEVRIVLEQLRNAVAATLGAVVQNAAHKHCDGQFAVAVYVHVQQIVVAVVFQLQPSAACGHCRRVVDGFAVFVAKDVAVHTGRTHKLRHDDTLGTVDDEAAGVRHEGEVAHEYVLVDKLARTFVGQADGEAQRLGVCCVTDVALFLGILGLVLETVFEEVQTEVSGKVFDGGKVLENFLDALLHEVAVTVLLHLDEVGQRQHFLALRERFSVVISVSCCFDVLYH